MPENSPHSVPAPHGLDRQKLEQLLEPIAHAHGAEVVEIEFKPERNGWVLRVFVEKAGSSEQRLSTEQAAVDLQLCSNIARELSPALDATDLIPHSYHLEISSPGVERPLRGAKDFIRFVGKKAKLKLQTTVAGQKVLIGTIGPVQEDRLLLSERGRTVEVPIESIASARLVFEFGPAPKPGKKISKG